MAQKMDYAERMAEAAAGVVDAATNVVDVVTNALAPNPTVMANRAKWDALTPDEKYSKLRKVEPEGKYFVVVTSDNNNIRWDSKGIDPDSTINPGNQIIDRAYRIQYLVRLHQNDLHPEIAVVGPNGMYFAYDACTAPVAGPSKKTGKAAKPSIEALLDEDVA